MTRGPRRALAVALAVAASAALFELGALVLVESGVVAAPAPSYAESDLWWGDHPVFGVWHRPNAEEEHASRCFRVTYRTNSVGARDVERPLRADGPRVVVLGDSFLEGWGLPASARLSNLLEEETGVPHPNFAMAHFGPYQEYLLYRDLARRFDHHAVLVGVLPANDFADLDLRLSRTLADYDYRYRPYLVGDPPALRHLDYREPAWHRLLRRYSYAFAAVRHVWPERPEARAPDRNAAKPSFFYDFDERQLGLLEAALGRLADAAEGRPVAVVLIPLVRDLGRYVREGPDPLSRRLAPFAERRGIRLVNLLPAMAEHTGSWRSYFLPCDYHWSRYGNRVAAQHVLEELGPSFWKRDPGRRAAP